jgi:hypothetical protein
MLLGVEDAAERALHVARGLFVAVLVAVFVVRTPAPAVWIGVVAAPAAAAVWLLVWHALCSARPPVWVPYALILFDAWIAVRGPVAVRTPLYRALGLDAFLSPSGLAALGVPVLVLVAIMGGFRLSPHLATASSPSSKVRSRSGVRCVPRVAS